MYQKVRPISIFVKFSVQIKFLTKKTITPLIEGDKQNYREASLLKTVQNVHTLQYVCCVDMRAMLESSKLLCLIAWPENPPDKDNKQRNIQKPGERLNCSYPSRISWAWLKISGKLLNFNPEILFKMMNNLTKISFIKKILASMC